MTELQERERQSDFRDIVDRQVFEEQEFLDGAGSIVRCKGTGTEELECAVLNIGGVSFNLPKGSNTEVVVLSGGSDTNLKLAILTIPRDKQRQWGEGHGGVQHPLNAGIAVDISDKRTHVTQGDFATGAGGVFEVRGDTVYIRGRLVVESEVVANTRVLTPNVDPGTDPVPGFDP